jgi:hypothetical protein
MSACADCERKADDLGAPSSARWVGPDGGEYCSMHFVHRFGHQEKLVRIDGYEAPTQVKPPAPRASTRGGTSGKR